jgi:ankyrin repeat protein
MKAIRSRTIAITVLVTMIVSLSGCTSSEDSSYKANLSQDPVYKILDMAARGEARKIETLLRDDPSLANVKGAKGRTALHHAAEAGSCEVVERLLTAGANPNLKDEYGETPLHDAARAGHKDVVVLLLSRRDMMSMRETSTGTPRF